VYAEKASSFFIFGPSVRIKLAGRKAARRAGKKLSDWVTELLNSHS
jgi:hypothetical protein